MASASFPSPPIEPMLAKVADALPAEPGFLFEPKWDGFRALVFRDPEGVHIQSRDLKPLNRYFPELEKVLAEQLPRGCIVDGEIVVAGPNGLDFDALQQRIHPAASRIARLAKETPAGFVAFDLLAAGGRSIMDLPQQERRTRLERLLGSARPPLYLTPVTSDREQAQDWLQRFEGAGLDGVIAKPANAPYQPAKRAMFKIKHARTADCVVAGFRWYKDSTDVIGSLLLGLYNQAGVLQHVGVTSSFTRDVRRQLAQELAPLRDNAMENHPWRDWAQASAGDADRMPGAKSRWSGGKDLGWEPLRPERVCEVKYDHLQGDRFRHATTFLRWRPDKAPQDCRYDQLETATPFELQQVLTAR
ncbi:ATP-dependent DNA ligase [Ramlibacter tataouinensis]|uniref:ATP-dependent DNA ligase n=1 Tax=Ramlibacter tataouinensis TaxID=94132 RepID=UPI0022F3A904|nr:ATP-dependent DNA ligase [Ramlibacter tataouinensis]WBY03656.1 ATP-dependent DNA ligase [Ramlibacter tataouinensis]